MEYHSFEEESAWLEALEENWKRCGSTALDARGTFKVCLAGGSTPAVLYRKIASMEWPFEATTFFIGDERYVPMDHKDSNYRMIYEAFYPHRIRLMRWKTELADPAQAAKEYEREMKQDLSTPPRFDLVLLGLGEDGHTASLFAGTAALKEDYRLAIENRVHQLGAYRLTMTYPLLDFAREIWFLTRGEKKRPWIDKLVAGGDDSFPAGAVRCEKGEIRLFHCVT